MSTQSKLLILLAAFLLLRGGGVAAPSNPPLILMLHEASHGDLPAYAHGAARKLEAAGRQVRMIDDDVLAGTGNPPTWLAPVLESARKIMGPDEQDDALVLVDGSRVVKAVKLPATEAEIVEACK